MNLRRLRTFLIRSALLTCLLAPGLAFAQDAGPPDPQRAADAPLPSFDPDAMRGDRTAMELAGDLVDPMWVRRFMALEELAAMGVDALPARDAVRFVFNRDWSDEDVSAPRVDALRLDALAVLFTMQAPEASALLREALVNPSFSDDAGTYRTLADAAAQDAIPEDVLRADVLRLANTDPDHATLLLSVRALPSGVQRALGEAVFRQDHGDDATRYLLRHLHELEGIEVSERLAYVAGHPDLAEEEMHATHDALVAIGSEDAMHLAVRIGDLAAVPRLRVMGRFAATLGPDTVVARIVDEMLAADTQEEIGLIVSGLEMVVSDRVSPAITSDDHVTADRERNRFPAALTRLIEEAPSDAHAIEGVERQVLFLQRNPGTDTVAALDPVFDLLEDPSTPGAVRTAAAEALVRTPRRIAEGDPEYFVARTLDLLWEGTDARTTELPVRLLLPLAQAPAFSPLVVASIAEEIDGHMDRWAVNAANAVSMASGTAHGLERSETRELASVVMGKVFTSPAIDMAFLGDHLARGGGVLANLEHNTVAGLIGILEPTIFHNDGSGDYPFPTDGFAAPMLTRATWFAHEPESLRGWTAFLQRVVDLDDPDFSPTARRALGAL